VRGARVARSRHRVAAPRPRRGGRTEAGSPYGVDEPVGQRKRLVGVDGERERAGGEPDAGRLVAGQRRDGGSQAGNRVEPHVVASSSVTWASQLLGERSGWVSRPQLGLGAWRAATHARDPPQMRAVAVVVDEAELARLGTTRRTRLVEGSVVCLNHGSADHGRTLVPRARSVGHLRGWFGVGYHPLEATRELRPCCTPVQYGNGYSCWVFLCCTHGGAVELHGGRAVWAPSNCTKNRAV
jgi:hypothetical protein